MQVACDTIELVAVWKSGTMDECCAACANIARDNPHVEELRPVPAVTGICEWCEAEAEFGGGNDDAE